MSLLEAFGTDPNADKLERRRDGFAAIMEHLDHAPPGFIVETGVSRKPDNWAGDGMSTAWWNWVVGQNYTFEAVSFDIDQAACEWARKTFPEVEIHCGDSVQGLSNLPHKILSRIRLLYLDSFDWSVEQNLDSAFHHFKELATVWALLPAGCLIVIDDRHSDAWGKHAAVAAFMANLGIAPAFVGYQIGWIKP